MLRHELLGQREVFRWLNRTIFTLYFLPEAAGKIESICIVGDGELSCIAGGSSEEADFVFCIESDAVTKPGEGCISEDIYFFERHLSNQKSNYDAL